MIFSLLIYLGKYIDGIGKREIYNVKRGSLLFYDISYDVQLKHLTGLPIAFNSASLCTYIDINPTYKELYVPSPYGYNILICLAPDN